MKATKVGGKTNMPKYTQEPLGAGFQDVVVGVDPENDTVIIKRTRFESEGYVHSYVGKRLPTEMAKQIIPKVQAELAKGKKPYVSIKAVKYNQYGEPIQWSYYVR